MELKKLPQIKIWTDEPTNLSKHKLYKGKFVMAHDGKFFAKLFPEKEYDGSKFFHNEVLEEMGVKKADSPAVKKEVEGGGKMEVELIEDYVEVRLHGKSSIYGPYNPDCVDIGEIEGVIHTMFDLIDLPILVIPDLES
ncbi:hypothetical protein KJ657_04155 [Patescibacteria group bacterium]|nr:hypothetical protein [Patescibacteria group bacterium]MBU1016257.1 hypothetical protein [Patescibacteria group bacterium]MBU1685489.1 hypothetical protein [Patescibacteria group bacterium]MBU1939115.1 hypothetical protein [Patescibacteria group bacterium]